MGDNIEKVLEDIRPGSVEDREKLKSGRCPKSDPWDLRRSGVRKMKRLRTDR